MTDAVFPSLEDWYIGDLGFLENMQTSESNFAVACSKTVSRTALVQTKQ